MEIWYITSLNRSGSTLLDVMLSSHSEIASVGELHLADVWIEGDELCTCGRPISSCELWRRVVSRWEQHGLPRTQVDRVWDVGFPLVGPTEREARRYTASTISAAEEVLAFQDASIVIDSSKRLGRLCLLIASGLVSVRVIHLVRDCRGVAYSYLQEVERPGMRNDELSHVRGTVKTSLDWLRHGLLTEIVRSRYESKDFIRITYEELASNPERVIRCICAKFGVEFESRMCSPKLGDLHNIAGSRVRFGHGSLDVVLDDSWREGLKAHQKIAVEAMTGWMQLILDRSVKCS